MNALIPALFNTHSFDTCEAMTEQEGQSIAKIIFSASAIFAIIYLAWRVHKATDYPLIDFKQRVKRLASDIEAGKQLPLEDLTSIILRSIEKGVDRELHSHLETLRKRKKEIIDANHDPVSFIPDDIVGEILPYLSASEIARFATVAKNWRGLTSTALIKVINEKQLPLEKIFKGKDAHFIVDWLINHNVGKSLLYADFTRVYGFNNDCLEKLTNLCPKLLYLLIPGSKITWDALENLSHIPELLTLNVSHCIRLDNDALKQLARIPKLQSLNISYCCGLEKDALKYLKYVPNLLNLNSERCDNLLVDLAHLRHTPKLLKLNIASCLVEGNTLSNLEYTPELECLTIASLRLEADALKNLEFTGKLKKLNIVRCRSLEADALKNLVNTHQLRKLEIGYCTNLEADALKHLKNTSELQKLSIPFCDQFDIDSLKYLEYTPKMQKILFLPSQKFDMTKMPWKLSLRKN